MPNADDVGGDKSPVVDMLSHNVVASQAVRLAVYDTSTFHGKRSFQLVAYSDSSDSDEKVGITCYFGIDFCQCHVSYAVFLGRAELNCCLVAMRLLAINIQYAIL